MADAKPKDKEAARSVNELTRLIRGELAVTQIRSRDIWPRIGGYLIEMKPQIAKGKWERYIRDNFEFSTTSADRYMRFHREVAANRKPTRLSDVDPPRPNHQPKGFASWRAASKGTGTPPRTRWDTESAKADRPREKELGLELIEAGYKLLAQKYHPDKGGDDASFRCLTNARAKLRRCLLA
jgi:hypothetical protein